MLEIEIQTILPHFRRMSAERKTIRIAVVEDNEYYNHLLTSGLKVHLASLPYASMIHFEINSYTNAHDALVNITKNTDIVFLDYYLGDMFTGLDILRKIKKVNPHCKVVMLSQVKNLQTSLIPLLEGASDFVFKDAMAISKSCQTASQLIDQKLRYA
jgi:DNA-binding NtrC family response regulator